MRKAKCYIKNHYGEQITLEEVSAEVGLSTAYFSVLFKKETEVGICKIPNECAHGAGKDAASGDQPSGGRNLQKSRYNDLKHFTHTFEKLAGVNLRYTGNCMDDRKRSLE